MIVFSQIDKALHMYNSSSFTMGRFVVIFIVNALLFFQLGKSDISTCELPTKKLGCLKKDTSIFNIQLANNRDHTNPSYTGTTLEWGDYPKHLRSLLCHCYKKAMEQEFIAISITFYGECYGTKDRQRLTAFLKEPTNRRSICFDSKYGNCQDTSDLDCTGEDKSQYVYLVQSKYDEFICGENYTKCHEKALCILDDENSSCQCKQGYIGNGESCKINEINECKLNLHTCHANATCIDTHEHYQCSCKDGFIGNGTICEDFDECKAEVAHCPTNSTCVNLIGSFDCFCNSGYQKCENTCKDVDECSDPDLNRCHAKAKCENTIGSYMCFCQKGYSGDGYQCGDLNECSNNSMNNCHQNALCLNTEGSYQCYCQKGFYGNGRKCFDFNECYSPTTHNCHQHSNCVNNIGSYTCQCRNGFIKTANDTTCIDINECSSTNQCHQNATCTNNFGSYSCKCHEGFTGDGFKCDNVNECQLGNNKCHPNAECVDNIGGYSCKCQQGFTGNGEICFDKNECLESPSSCHPNAECLNTIGSFKCQCKSGYKSNGTFCQDLNECLDVNLHHCFFGKCINTVGSYTCHCYSGFEMKNGFCQDKNECVTGESKCHQNATCVNAFGSYKCFCDSGFHGDGIQCKLVKSSTVAWSLIADFIDEHVKKMFEQQEQKLRTEEQEQIEDLLRTIQNRSVAATQRCAACHQNATCSIDKETYETKCVCSIGFIGNGSYCSPELVTSSKYPMKTTETVDSEKDGISIDVQNELNIDPPKGKQITGKLKGNESSGSAMGVTSFIMALFALMLVFTLICFIHKKFGLKCHKRSSKVDPKMRKPTGGRFRSLTSMFNGHFNRKPSTASVNYKTEDMFDILKHRFSLYDEEAIRNHQFPRAQNTTS
uniref:Uncharacterized protein n=1 Tax=Clytia hemisphaerica TaxID=252671 RepID=A0A7M5X013_9CNID